MRSVSGMASELLLFSSGKCEEELGASAEPGLHPYLSTGSLYNPLANGESHAAAGVIGNAVETLEQSKDLLLVLRIDAYAVIPD